MPLLAPRRGYEAKAPSPRPSAVVLHDISRKDGDTTLVMAIIERVRGAIAEGMIKPGDRLASSRRMASDLGVARGTVLAAIDALMAEGILIGHRGAGTYVSPDAGVGGRKADLSDVPPPLPRCAPVPAIIPPFVGGIDFAVCTPSVEAFPLGAWRRAVALAASNRPDGDYGSPRGEMRLRSAITGYLRRARGLAVDERQVIVTNGAIQAVNLVARMYLRPGDRVAMEEPGYPLARQVFEMAGAEILPIQVDNEGLVVERLPRHDRRLRLAYVTPSHQFPMGSRLSMVRRQQLVEWASQRRALILEDDYDGEFRYDVPPLAPLATHSAARNLVYLGTFSKSMFPALRIGFAAGPADIIDAMASYRIMMDYQTSALPQQALARFIEAGELERHVARMRRLYSERRMALADAIQRTGLPGKLTGIEAGLNGLLELEPGFDAEAVAATAAREGVGATPLNRYAMSRKARSALVVGYSALSVENIGRGVEVLARVMTRRSVVRDANAQKSRKSRGVSQ